MPHYSFCALIARSWRALLLTVGLGLAASVGAQAQHLLPTKFHNCNTAAFSLEHDTITVRTDHAELVRLIEESMDEKVKGTVRGTLALQILVDQAGNSCLLSLQNGTNVRTSKLHLPETINERLKWQAFDKDEKVSPVVVIDFTSQGAVVKRYGFDMQRGRHELKDKRG